MDNSILNQSYSQGVKRIVGSCHSIKDFKVPDKVINQRKTKWSQFFEKYIQLTQILGDEEEETLSLYSCSYPSADDKTGASSTPNVWENRLRFRKSLSCTERWVEASIQYTKVQTRPPSSACDEVGQEHELVLYPQSLENASTTKLSDIEPNQNTIREKSLCDNSTAPEEHPLSENGSILTLDSPIHVTTCLDQVSDKPLVYKTLKETDNQAELLKSDCFGSHLSREKLNHSNTEQPLIESISSPSSRKESVSAIYLNKLRPYLSEAGDNDSEISVGIPSSRPIACKNSNKHKVGSSASLDNGNIQLKESSQKKEHLSLKRSNDASISSPCKKQKLVEEIEAQVSEESTSPSRSSIDLNSSNVKMSRTNSPAVPKGRLNVTLPPSEHPDVVSSKGNSPLISRRTDGNKCTLEREDPQNISFSPEEFIYSDSVCSKSAATSKCKNKRTDKTENSSEIKCPREILDSEIAKINDSFKIPEVNHCLTPSSRIGSQTKHDQRLETNSSLMLSTSHDSIFSKSTQCTNIRSHESSLVGSSALKNQNRLITPRIMKSFTSEKSTNLWDFDRNNKHNSILSLPGEKKLQEVPSAANSSLTSKFSPGPLKIKDTPYRNICLGKSIQTSKSCDISKDMSNLCTEDSFSKSCHKKNIFDGATGEDMINKIKSSVFLNYMKSGPRNAHETYDGDSAPSIPKRKKRHKKRHCLVMDISGDESDTKLSKTTTYNIRLPTVDSLKSRKCKIARFPSCEEEIMLGSTKQNIVSGKAVNLIKIDSKMAENSKKNRNSFEHGFYPTDLQSKIFLDGNYHSLQGCDSIIHSSSNKISFLSLLNGNDASKRNHMLGCNKRDKMPETGTLSFNCNIITCEDKKKDGSSERTKESISKRKHVIPCDLKKKDNSLEITKEIISNRKHIIPFECQSFTHLYAIGDKPSKMNRSKLKKLRKIFMDKVTDQRFKKSNVCSENKIDTKHIIRSSESRLYLSDESVLFIDKGGKQSIEQNGSTGEEGEKSNHEISELLYQENRTKPCSPITAVSTNSQFFNIERKSNSNIFADILLSEDIFTVSKRVSNKNNKKLDQTSLDSSPRARLIENQSLKLVSPIPQKLTNSRNLEDKTQKKFVLANEKLSTSNVYKRQSDASFTTLGCEEETTPGTLPRSDTEMMDDNIEKRCLKEVLDSSSCISSHKQDCKELAGRKEKIHFEDKIDARHSSIFPSASNLNKSSDEENFSLIKHCNRNMETKILNTSFKTKINPTKSSSDENISPTKDNCNNKKIHSKTIINPTKGSSDEDVYPTIESCNNKITHSKTRINPIKSSSDEDNFPLIQYCDRKTKTKIQKTNFKTKINSTKSSSDENISPTKENCNNKKIHSKTRINLTQSSSDEDIYPTMESWNNKMIHSKSRNFFSKRSSDEVISQTIENCKNKKTHSKTRIHLTQSSSNEDIYPTIVKCNKFSQTKPHDEKSFPIIQNSTRESKTEFKIGLPKTKLSFSECISTDEEIEHSNKAELKRPNTYSKNKLNHKKYSSLTEYSTTKQKPNEHTCEERKFKNGEEKMNITKIAQKFKSNGNSNVLKQTMCARKVYVLSDESVSSKPQHQRQDLDDASKPCSKITYVNKSKSLGSLCEYSSSLTQKPTNRVKKSSLKSQSKTSTSQKENSQPTLVETSSNNETSEHSSLLSESNNSGISEESISLDDSETWSDWCRRVSGKHLSKAKT